MRKDENAESGKRKRAKKTKGKSAKPPGLATRLQLTQQGQRIAHT